MHAGFVSVPVKLADQHGGLASATGILRTDLAGVMVEYEIKDTFIGVIRSGVRETLIDWSSIESVQLKSGLFGCRIEVAARTMKAVEGIPGADRGMIGFSVERRHRESAGDFVTSAMLLLSEYRLKAALDRQDRNELPE